MINPHDVGIEREQDEEDITMESSTDSLGQQYQFENKYNNLLPYADELDEEARNLLADIKGQLGRGVILRRFHPDCYLATFKLRMYLKVYHCRFTKEDHITFVKLMYNLITIPTLEPSLVNLFGTTLISLLKKIELISASELELPWRPLYDLMLRGMGSYSETRVVIGMQRCTPNILKTVRGVIHVARNYFPVSATQEILDELRPNLCPFHVPLMIRTFQVFELFLPVHLSLKDSVHGYKLWLDEFMKFWEVYHNGPSWEHYLMALMARLAFYNIGYIDWEPHIPLMFSRFMRSLNLPVQYKKIGQIKSQKINMPVAAEWIVSVLGNGSSCQTHLEKFLKAIETYFHQANFGSWVERLKEFLVKLASEFILRLRHERFGKKSWLPAIPDSHKLTDADVDAFVKCMMPVAMTAMFGNTTVLTTCKVLRLLATIRPNMVIPCVMERLYLTLDSLTEPHKFTATMMAVTAIARPMAQGRRNINTNYTYNEGPSKILSLLFSALPGIDANDLRKSYVTFRLIFAYAMVVPIVDCSKATDSELLDEEEKMVCAETSQFEDFVLQYFDRIFSLIESSTLEYVSHENQDSGAGKSRSESLVEYFLVLGSSGLLSRSSNDIFRSALHKLRTFVTERVLETRVSGSLAAALCQNFAVINGRETLRALIPPISQTILEILEEGDIVKEEHTDDRLLYPMLLLSRIVNTQGNELLPYMDTLIEILDKVLHLRSREGSQMASKILQKILHSLSMVSATRDFTINGRDYNDPNYPYVVDWGQGADISNINMHWYVPGEQEIAMIQHLFTRYLPPEVAKIQEFCTKENSEITRQELMTSLTIINSIIDGCDDLLPLPDQPGNNLQSKIIVMNAGIKGEIKMPDGSNVLQSMVNIMTSLQAAMLKNSEDDIKSLFVLHSIWSTLLLGKFRTADGHRKEWSIWRQIKTDLKDDLVKKQKMLPECLVERVGLHQKLRAYSRLYYLTEFHKFILLKLIELATSTYPGVRALAQETIFTTLRYYPYSYNAVLPSLLELLAKDPEEHHEALKGLFFLLVGSRENSLMLTKDWKFIRSLWPVIISSKPSEKMSIIRLKNILADLVDHSIPTLAIKLEITDNCITTAAEFWNNSPKPSTTLPIDAEINEGLNQMQELEKQNIDNYDNLLLDLLHATESTLHWRHRVLGMRLMKNLAHLDRPYPSKVVNYFLGALVHDSLEERKIATYTVVIMLGQLKRKPARIEIDIPGDKKQSVEAGRSVWTDETIKPGARPDNLWLQYNYETRPVTEEEWEKPRFIHASHIGYYTWPKKLEVYAPPSMQPTLDHQNRVYTESEKFVDEFFSEPLNVAKLIQYNSLEERKGQDHFSIRRFVLYKNLFRNHGIRHLDVFITHLQSLIDQKQESSQRCAAEIISGILRGTKHWPFAMIETLREKIIPIIRQALDNITTETAQDWEFCFAAALTCRDPNRYSWLFECLMEEPALNNTETSFLECERMSILYSVVALQSWRLAELLRRILERAERKLLTNPFQNVRDTLGSLLMIIFMADYNTGTFRSNDPTLHAEDLLDRLLPRLLKLGEDVQAIDTSEESTLARASDISILKTICKWIVSNLILSSKENMPRSATLLPILCQLENSETDDELRTLCQFALASLSQSLTLPRNIDLTLNALAGISKSPSWSSRASCLGFMEVFVFHNLGVIVSNPKWVEDVQEIVLRLLADERLEVREKAGQVLCGLLHCAIVPEQEALLNEFKIKSKTKIRNPDDLRLRHTGVIGLCAFIRAHPYDVPKYVPAIFEYLNRHLNDPLPIPSTIRTTLGDFKRTHYDGWASHIQSFTEEQLAILQDLTVPPSYYA